MYKASVQPVNTMVLCPCEKIILLIPFLIGSLFCHAQKSFHLTVAFPKTIDTKSIKFYLDDGRHADILKPNFAENGKVGLTGEFFGLKGAVDIQYAVGDVIQGRRFFLHEEPGVIRFLGSRDTEHLLDQYTLINVEDFKSEQLNMSLADSAERRVGREYEIANGDKIYSGKFPDIQKYYFSVILKNIARKKLGYIISNPDSYYSFYSFRTDIVWPGVLPPDSAMYFLNTLFPENFKNSDEGNDLKDYISARAPRTPLDPGMDFLSMDINNNRVRLSDLKGKNPVLLHFWATWCSPCVKELPLIAEMDSLFRGSGLRIISIALRSTRREDFSSFIKKYKMNWTHIYDDQELIYRYGNYPVPRLILIGKAGTIIYDSFQLENNDDRDLSRLRKLMKEEMKL